VVCGLAMMVRSNNWYMTISQCGLSVKADSQALQRKVRYSDKGNGDARRQLPRPSGKQALAIAYSRGGRSLALCVKWIWRVTADADVTLPMMGLITLGSKWRWWFMMVFAAGACVPATFLSSARRSAGSTCSSRA